MDLPVRETALLRLKGQLNEDIAELARLELTDRRAQERIDTGANDELRAFRHVFRNRDQGALDAERPVLDLMAGQPQETKNVETFADDLETSWMQEDRP